METNYRRPRALKQGCPLTEYTGKTVEELQVILSNTAGMVKIYCGAANNACYYAMTDAIDKLKEAKLYKQEVKKNFNLVLKKWKEYENRLIYANELRYFNLEDMPEATRKKYGDITNREYFEYWQASGGEAYYKARNEIGCLRHKYFLSMQAHGDKYAEPYSWVLVAMAMLEAAVATWESTIGGVMEPSGLPRNLLEDIFKCFKLDDIATAWRRAMIILTPGVNEYNLSAEEERNIEFGISGLFTKFSEMDFILSTNQSAAESYEEVFRTKGECKKQQRVFAEAKEEIKES